MLIRKKRGASGSWRVHGDDVKTAMQLLACGLVRGARIHSRESADRFVEMGFARRSAGQFALTGRGIFATLRSAAVWAEAWSMRRLAARRAPASWAKLPKGWPLIASAAMLADATTDAIRIQPLGPMPLPADDLDAAIEAAITKATRVSPFVESAEAAGLRPRIDGLAKVREELARGGVVTETLPGGGTGRPLRAERPIQQLDPRHVRGDMDRLRKAGVGIRL